MHGNSLDSRTGIAVEFLVGVGRVADDAELIRAVFSFIVAESTVFCLLKLLGGA